MESFIIQQHFWHNLQHACCIKKLETPTFLQLACCIRNRTLKLSKIGHANFFLFGSNFMQHTCCIRTSETPTWRRFIWLMAPPWAVRSSDSEDWGGREEGRGRVDGGAIVADHFVEADKPLHWQARAELRGKKTGLGAWDWEGDSLIFPSKRHLAHGRSDSRHFYRSWSCTLILAYLGAHWQSDTAQWWEDSRLKAGPRLAIWHIFERGDSQIRESTIGRPPTRKFGSSKWMYKSVFASGLVHK